MDLEIWRDCCGKWFGYYQVSDFGRVRNKALGRGRVANRVLFQSQDNKGYPQVYLYKGGKQTTVKVHRLVAESFLGVREDGYHVDHVDGIKTNNQLENLELVSPKENSLRARRLGLQTKPYSKTKPKGKKLTFKQAQDIRSLASYGVSRKIIAEQYGIHRMTVGEIIREEIWKEATHKKPDR